MTSVRWTTHALQYTADREISRDVTARRLSNPNLRERRDQTGIIADSSYDGGIVHFEVLRASQVVEKTNEMQFAFAA
jgi:hypothetical protein